MPFVRWNSANADTRDAADKGLRPPFIPAPDEGLRPPFTEESVGDSKHTGAAEPDHDIRNP